MHGQLLEDCLLPSWEAEDVFEIHLLPLRNEVGGSARALVVVPRKRRVEALGDHGDLWGSGIEEQGGG